MALVIVLLIVGVLWLYSGVWPPLVVVESNSMQHSDSESFIGVIDTGDLVILKKETSLAAVHTYIESVHDGYSTYGELGDVVIYKPLGRVDRTPIIHRALCKVVYNTSGGGFDVPSLASIPDGTWEVRGGAKTPYNMHGTLVLHDIGYNKVEVRVNFTIMLSNFVNTQTTPHGGLITLGDNNHGVVDQSTISGVCWQPVEEGWLNGVARGEIPWFGLIKLYVGGQTSQVPIPENSKNNLIISLGLIIGIPIAIDLLAIVLASRGIDAGAWLRKKLRLPPKKPKPRQDVKPEMPPSKPKKKSDVRDKDGGRPKSGPRARRPSSGTRNQGKGKRRR